MEPLDGRKGFMLDGIFWLDHMFFKVTPQLEPLDGRKGFMVNGIFWIGLYFCQEIPPIGTTGWKECVYGGWILF